MKKTNRGSSKKIVGKRISTTLGIEYLYVDQYSSSISPRWIKGSKVYNQDDVEDFEKALLSERQRNHPPDTVDISNVGICSLLEEARGIYTTISGLENMKLGDKGRSEISSIPFKSVPNISDNTKILNIPSKSSTEIHKAKTVNILNKADHSNPVNEVQLINPSQEEITTLISGSIKRDDIFNIKSSQKVPKNSDNHPEINYKPSGTNPALNKGEVSPHGGIKASNLVKNPIESIKNPDIQSSIDSIKSVISDEISKRESTLEVLNKSLNISVDEPNWEDLNIGFNANSLLEGRVFGPPGRISTKARLNSSQRFAESLAKPLKASKPSQVLPEPVILHSNNDSIHSRFNNILNKSIPRKVQKSNHKKILVDPSPFQKRWPSKNDTLHSLRKAPSLWSSKFGVSSNSIISGKKRNLKDMIQKDIVSSKIKKSIGHSSFHIGDSIKKKKSLSNLIPNKGAEKFENDDIIRLRSPTYSDTIKRNKKAVLDLTERRTPIVFIGSQEESEKLRLSIYSNIYSTRVLDHDVLRKKFDEESSDILISGKVFGRKPRNYASKSSSIFNLSCSQTSTPESEEEELILMGSTSRNSISGPHSMDGNISHTSQIVKTKDSKRKIISSSEESAPSIHDFEKIPLRSKRVFTKKSRNISRLEKGDSDSDYSPSLSANYELRRSSRNGNLNYSSYSKGSGYLSFEDSEVVRHDSQFYNSDISEGDIQNKNKFHEENKFYDHMDESKEKPSYTNTKISDVCEFCNEKGVLLTLLPQIDPDSIRKCDKCTLSCHSRCLEGYLQKYPISKNESSLPIEKKAWEVNINQLKASESWVCIFCKIFNKKIKKILSYRSSLNNEEEVVDSEVLKPIELSQESVIDSSLINNTIPDPSIGYNTQGSSSLSNPKSEDSGSPHIDSSKDILINLNNSDKSLNSLDNPSRFSDKIDLIAPKIEWKYQYFLVLFEGSSYRDLSWVPAFHIKNVSSIRFKNAIKNIALDTPEWRKVFIPPSYTQVDFFLDIEVCNGDDIISRTQQLRGVSDKSAADAISVAEYENFYIYTKRALVKWVGLPVVESTFDEPPHPYAESTEYKQWLEASEVYKNMRKVSSSVASNYLQSFFNKIFRESIKLKSKELSIYNTKKNSITQKYKIERSISIAEYRRLNSQIKQIHLKELQNIKEIENSERQKWLENSFQEIKEQPKYLSAGKLYPYQLEGINWMLYKWMAQESCILADEMGLGKTVQVVCFFAILARLMDKNSKENSSKNIFLQNKAVFPFLVVVPNSVIDQWIRELHLWAPDLVVVGFHGDKASRKMVSDHLLFRQTDNEPSNQRDLQCHVLVTSYEVVTREEGLKTLKMFNGQWQCMVVDEGHRLKNDSSKLFLNLGKLNSRQRILLTGTPVQNQVREVINLMNFVCPEEFEDPDSMGKEYFDVEEEKLAELREKMQPHLLRRLRDEVLGPLLPAKHELIVPVSLTLWQRELYRATLKKNIKALSLIQKLFENSKNEEHSNKGRHLSINNALMQIRKIIDHPYIMEFNVPEFETEEAAQKHLVLASGKMQLLNLLVPELIKRGRRVLIFVQFKDMLNNLEDYFYREKIGFLRMDGNTPQADRQYLVDLYNNNPDRYFAFICTTRAGGVGLNLHTADTVILYSPDWNPHMDMQALSRSYRIGQKKPVLVLKLMTIESAEERIFQVGTKKMLIDHILIEKMANPDEFETENDFDIASAIKCGAEQLFKEDEDSSTGITYDENKVKILLDECERALIDADEIKRNGSDVKSGIDHPPSKNLFSHARIWDANKNAEEDLDESFKNNDSQNTEWIDKIKLELQSNSIDEEQLGRGFRRKVQVSYFDSGLLASKDPIKPNLENTHQRKKSDSDVSFSAVGVESDSSSDPDFIEGSKEITKVDKKSKTKHNSNISNPALVSFPINQTGNFTLNQTANTNENLPLSKIPLRNSIIIPNQPSNYINNYNISNSSNLNLSVSRPKSDLSYLVEADPINLGPRLIIDSVSIGEIFGLEGLLQMAVSNGYTTDLHSVVSQAIKLSGESNESYFVATLKLCYFLTICCQEAIRIGPKYGNPGFLAEALDFITKPLTLEMVQSYLNELARIHNNDPALDFYTSISSLMERFPNLINVKAPNTISEASHPNVPNGDQPENQSVLPTNPQSSNYDSPIQPTANENSKYSNDSTSNIHEGSFIAPVTNSLSPSVHNNKHDQSARLYDPVTDSSEFKPVYSSYHSSEKKDAKLSDSLYIPTSLNDGRVSDNTVANRFPPIPSAQVSGNFTILFPKNQPNLVDTLKKNSGLETVPNSDNLQTSTYSLTSSKMINSAQTLKVDKNDNPKSQNLDVLNGNIAPGQDFNTLGNFPNPQQLGYTQSSMKNGIKINNNIKSDLETISISSETKSLSPSAPEVYQQNPEQKLTDSNSNPSTIGNPNKSIQIASDSTPFTEKILSFNKNQSTTNNIVSPLTFYDKQALSLKFDDSQRISHNATNCKLSMTKKTNQRDSEDSVKLFNDHQSILNSSQEPRVPNLSITLPLNSNLKNASISNNVTNGFVDNNGGGHSISQRSELQYRSIIRKLRDEFPTFFSSTDGKVNYYIANQLRGLIITCNSVNENSGSNSLGFAIISGIKILLDTCVTILSTDICKLEKPVSIFTDHLTQDLYSITYRDNIIKSGNAASIFLFAHVYTAHSWCNVE
ncbi:Chromatin remodeling factor mit1 [Smittium mucronatum]|uniref:Chromatin remodeling factor mit1 n=1 Tax=Smittium mucronatum TaxID=133383 RepID=A0A1R0H9D3_9FUNG|nr:Chromatin remodeling factor mit1 [Smittium mucronatum]